MLQDFNQIKASFKNKSAKIGVVGLGYVGLPLIMTFVDKKFQVYGFDIDETKITSLVNGKSYIRHISDKTIKKYIDNKQFKPTSDFTKISEVDAVLICVPTPLNENQEPDLSFIVSTGESIAPHLKSGQLLS